MKFHFSMNRVENKDKPLTDQESLMLDLQKTRWELENAVMKRYRHLLQLVAGLTPSDASVQEEEAAAKEQRAAYTL